MEPLQTWGKAVKRPESSQGSRLATRQRLHNVARPLCVKRCTVMETSGQSLPFLPVCLPHIDSHKVISMYCICTQEWYRESSQFSKLYITSKQTKKKPFTYVAYLAMVEVRKPEQVNQTGLESGVAARTRSRTIYCRIAKSEWK